MQNDPSLKPMFIPPGMALQDYTNGLGLNSCVFQIDRNTHNEILLHKLQKKNPPVISINGYISELTADYVRTALGILDLKYEEQKSTGSPTIHVEISTPGGDVNASFGIAGRLFESGYKAIGLVQEYAYSGGSLILQGCHGRYAAENAKLMFHYSGGLMHVTEHALESNRIKRIKCDFKEINEHLISWIAKRINVAYNDMTLAEREKTLRKLFVKERFIFPDEALRFHLIDGIIENFPEPKPKPRASDIKEGDVVKITTEQLQAILNGQNKN